MRGAGLLAAALLAALPARAGDEAERLARIRAEIEEREARAREYRQKAEGFLGELEALDRELLETGRSLERLGGARRAAEEDLERVGVGLEEARSALAGVERSLEARLVALYKFRARGGAAALYSGGDLHRTARRWDGLQRVLEQDRLLFHEHREARARWQSSREQGEALVAEIREGQREVARREELTRRRSVERRNLVALLRSRSEQEQRSAVELEEAARRLEEAVRRLPAERGGFDGEGIAAGRHPWPVQGSVRAPFGTQVDRRFGTRTLRHGIEIEAPEGVPVRAVADGRVLFADWFRGYGRLVIVDHGRGSVTVYGFLREISVAPGEAVQGGDTVGAVGHTGSLSGPGLYFEIRQDGRPVDPETWLCKGCASGERRAGAAPPGGKTTTN